MIQYKRREKEKFSIKCISEKGVVTLTGERGNVVIIAPRDFEDIFNKNGDHAYYKNKHEPFYEVQSKIINNENELLSFFIVKNNIGALLKMSCHEFNKVMEKKQ